MITYIVTEPQRLDTIVYEHYKTLDVYETVLEINAHLLNKYILELGDKVMLPTIQITKKVEDGALWD
ncbi:tail protein X [Sulfurimonas sp.]|uniref:tail protein X n=1 Tax=Sulfurimonas sp. TaxID=2022749 RepID=UPI002B48645F|nr:phage tail protein [Sulfurimonas sp.]